MASATSVEGEPSSAPRFGGDPVGQIVRAAGIGLWAAFSAGLAGPSLLRTSELFAFNADTVVPSDLILSGLSVITSPGPISSWIFRFQNPIAISATLFSTFLVGGLRVAFRKYRLQNLKHQSIKVEGEKAIWRSYKCENGELMSVLCEGVNTLYENFFSYSSVNYPNNSCLGTKISNEYEFESYAATAEKSTHFGSGLIHLGLNAESKLGIFSVNNAQWIQAELACYAYSMIVVALYSSLGQNAVEYVINHSEMTAVLCSVPSLSIIIDVAKNCPKLKHIIWMDNSNLYPSQSQEAELKSLGIHLWSFSEILNKGKSSLVNHIPPRSSDIATIMYTSGTTGNPKGVMLTHANAIATGSSYSLVEDLGLSLSEGDRYMSYLPLAHIFERSTMAVMFARGVAIGFNSGKIENLVDDLAALKPTVLVGVPRVFTRVYDKVMQTVDKSSPVKKFLVKAALWEANRVKKKGSIYESLPLWNFLVFRKIKSRLGGQCRVIISGGAPLSPEVQQFMGSAFGCPCIQGYGLTETSAAGTLARLDDTSTGHAGCIVPSVELKLEPVEEMNYSPSDYPHPRGEICFRGHSIMAGYYKEPGMTQEVIDDEKFFHTGDVGQVNTNGTISIIDRKKNIFKLSQGEYVAAEKLETIYSTSRFVSQIFVYGDSFKPCLVAIVVPEPQNLRGWALESSGLAQEKISTLTDFELCKLPGATDAVLDDLSAVAKSAKLFGFEAIKALYLESESFTIENNLLTPTFKLRRVQLKEKYLAIVDELYEKLE